MDDTDIDVDDVGNVDESIDVHIHVDGVDPDVNVDVDDVE